MEIREALKLRENERVEFKSASNQISIKGKSDDPRSSIMGYCVGIGNEGGGKLILGVSDDGHIVGTEAIKEENVENVKSQIYNLLGARVDITIHYPEADKRVVAINIPGRPIAKVYKYHGRALMRIGQELRDMDDEVLRQILLEADDFSSQQSNVKIEDISLDALNALRVLYKQKHPENTAISSVPTKQLLHDVGLARDGFLVNAGVIMLASENVLRESMPNAEIIFEYRNNKESTKYNERLNFRKPLLIAVEELWAKINNRNTIHQIQDGLIRRDIPSFNEQTIREALLNAVAHRDYRLGSSIFIRQSPEEIVFENPGGFLPGITVENIVNTPPSWRNRRLAESLEKVGLVERSGQGVDLIFRQTISEGKGIPDYTGSGPQQVVLKISTVIQDEEFLAFLEKIANEAKISLSIPDLILLEQVKEGTITRSIRKKELAHLINAGFIEPVGRGRGIEYILSHRYYAAVNARGLHTRLTGLSRDEKKQLILKHIEKNGKAFRQEFLQAFPTLTPKDVSNLLTDLRQHELIEFHGSRRVGYWVKSPKKLKKNNGK